MQVPAKFIQHLSNLPEMDVERLQESLQSQPHVSVHIHPLKNKQTISLEMVPWSNTGYYLQERPVFTIDPYLHSGHYYVQEASSMFLKHLFTLLTKNLHKPTVLDACAAPGGKSLCILSALHGEGLLLANETHSGRCQVLQQNIEKWGYANVIVCNNDPAAFHKTPSFFDIICCDAPCSGEGLFRKNKRAIGEWSENNVRLCAGRQKRILSDLWPSLKPGGFLVYSTCTYNQQENEDIMSWACRELDAENMFIEDAQKAGMVCQELNGIKGYRFYPFLCKGEGFFACILQKKGKTEKTFRNPKRNKNLQTDVQADKYVYQTDTLRAFSQQDSTFLFPLEYLSTLQHISNLLHIAQAGTPLYRKMGQKVKPYHALALSLHLKPDAFPQWEMNEQDILAYLARKEKTNTNGRKGLHLARYQHALCGFLNALETRSNNLYPAYASILMDITTKKATHFL